MAENSTVVDLFCGCGGLSWGLAQNGFRIMAGVDNWRVALGTFKRNHPGARVIEADISMLEPRAIAKELNLEREQLDLLVGGPPCQGFSKNVPASRRFLEDGRNLLVRSFLKYVEYFLPKVVLMENVAEIVNAFNGAFKHEICRLLDTWGYTVDVRVLLASEYGVPQRRRRAFFLANRVQKPVRFPSKTHEFPSKNRNRSLFPLLKPITVWDAIGDLPSLDAGKGVSPTDYSQTPSSQYQTAMRLDAKSLYDHVARPLKATQLARLKSLKAGENAQHLPARLRPRSHYSGAYGRLDKTEIAPTITRWVFHPGSGRYGHPVDDRVITIREAARIQSFSDDFVFEGKYIEKSHQVGNAVPPLLAKTFAPLIKKITS